MDSYRSTPEIQNVTKKEYHFFEKFNPDLEELKFLLPILLVTLTLTLLPGWLIVSCVTSSYKISDCFIDSYRVDPYQPQYGIKYQIILARKLRDNNSIQGFATFKEAKDAMDTLPECTIK